MTIKEDIDLDFKKMADLHEVAAYLEISPEELLETETLSNFILDYQQKCT